MAQTGEDLGCRGEVHRKSLINRTCTYVAQEANLLYEQARGTPQQPSLSQSKLTHYVLTDTFFRFAAAAILSFAAALIRRLGLGVTAPLAVGRCFRFVLVRKMPKD